MTATGKVWALSSGSYSDYRVLSVYPTKKEAEAAAEILNTSAGYEFFAEALPTFTGEPQRVVIYGLHCNIWDDGRRKVDNIWASSGAYAEPEQVADRVEWDVDPLYPERVRRVSVRWVRAPIHRGLGGRLEVYGTDSEAVRKAFGDNRAALLADDALRARREWSK